MVRLLQARPLIAVSAVSLLMAGCASAGQSGVPSATSAPSPAGLVSAPATHPVTPERSEQPDTTPSLSPDRTLPSAPPIPSTTADFVVLPTTPETVKLLVWPAADPQAFAEAACWGTSWLGGVGVHGCTSTILDAMSNASRGATLVICDAPDGSGSVFLGNLNPPSPLDPLSDAKLNCPDRVLRFVWYPGTWYPLPTLR